MSSNLNRALDFFSLEGLGAACTDSRFDQKELISTLITHTRHTDPNISLRGASLLWKITKDTLAVSGQLTTLTSTQETANGNRLTASSTRLLNSLNTRALPHEPRARPVTRTALTDVPTLHAPTGTIPGTHLEPATGNPTGNPETLAETPQPQFPPLLAPPPPLGNP